MAVSPAIVDRRQTRIRPEVLVGYVGQTITPVKDLTILCNTRKIAVSNRRNPSDKPTIMIPFG